MNTASFSRRYILVVHTPSLLLCVGLQYAQHTCSAIVRDTVDSESKYLLLLCESLAWDARP